MKTQHLAIACFAFAALALAGSADGSDVIRLTLPGDSRGADTLNLKATNADLALQIEDARYYRGGGYHGGGYRGGYHGGYHGGYGYRGGYYGGGFAYRGGYYGGYRGGYYGGYYGGGYRSFYGGSYGYRNYAYYPQYYTGYYYAPQYYGYAYYPSYDYAYPCSGTTTVVTPPPPSVTLRVLPNSTVIQPPVQTNPTNPPILPPPTLDDGKGKNGTFPYDGGPKDVIPMPKDGVPNGLQNGTQMGSDRRPRVVEDMAVGLSFTSGGASGSGKWQYPAYGEAPRRKSNGTISNSKFELIPVGHIAR